MTLTELSPAENGLNPRSLKVLNFARSELFDHLFHEGMELVEETAAYLDGDGRHESRLLTRSSALAYAGESMKLTTMLMQIASWLLVQRAVRESDMSATAACEARYRLAERRLATEPGHSDLPIALVEYEVRAQRLYDRVLHLDRRMYLDDADAVMVNPVQSQLARLTEAFGQG